ADLDAKAVLVLHYHRPDGDYRDWNAWVWTDTGEGKAYDFEHEDAFGRYALVPIDHVPDRYGFILRRGEWEMKDVDRDRFAPNAQTNVTEAWVTSGDPEVYADPDAIDLTPKLTAAFLDRMNQLTVTSTTPLKSRDLKDAKLVTAHGDIALKQLQKSDRQAQGKIVYDVTLRQPITPAMITGTMRLEVAGYDALPVFARDVLDDRRFLALDARLGPEATAESTTFRTWSPVASGVELLLYENGIDAGPTRTIALDPHETVWEIAVEGDLHGTPYRYRFTSYGQERTVADIHCFAALPGSDYSVVVDLGRTDPDGFDDHAVPTLANLTDEVIYEIHVRDFTMTCPHTPEELKGKYPGLVTPGTPEVVGPGEEGVATGLAHL
ncbi:MAG: pullulanase-associated domain-containing protein, partial [Planctomycetota bacterium]